MTLKGATDMQNVKSIFDELYEQYKNSDTKIGKKVFDALDTESIANIIVDGDTFWFEHNMYHDRVAQAVYNHLINNLTKQGYKYLYA